MFAEEDHFGEYEGNEDVGFSFEQLERLEAEKSTKSLIELDLKLYSEVEPSAPMDDAAGLEVERSPKYYSAGYDANYECIEDKELLQWRRTFPYLHVVGKSVATPSQESTTVFNCMPSSVNMNTFREEGTFICDETLVVVGKAAILHPRPSSFSGFCADCDLDEIIETHGVLEEIFAVDQSPSHSTNYSSQSAADLNEDNLCCGPAETQRDEVVAGLLSMIWPEVVGGMKPLVEKILRVAQDNNISLEEYRRSVIEDQELMTVGKKRPAFDQEDNGFDFNDDNGDDW